MTPPPAFSPGASEFRQESAGKGFVYLLRSFKTEGFYVGWTTDLNRRLQEHNSGKSVYTRSRGPWELVGYEVFRTAELARKREWALKRNPRMLYYFRKRLQAKLEPASRGQRQVVG